MFLANLPKPYTRPWTGAQFLRRQERRNGGNVLIQRGSLNNQGMDTKSFLYICCMQGQLNSDLSEQH